MTGLAGWAELDLEGKANVVWAGAGIALIMLVGYATVQTLKTHKKLAKRLHLDDEDGPS